MDDGKKPDFVGRLRRFSMKVFMLVPWAVPLIIAFLLFYPRQTGAVLAFALGVVSWLVTGLFNSWSNASLFFLAYLIFFVLFTVVCAIQAWWCVRMIGSEGEPSPPKSEGGPSPPKKDTAERDTRERTTPEEGDQGILAPGSWAKDSKRGKRLALDTIVVFGAIQKELLGTLYLLLVAVVMIAALNALFSSIYPLEWSVIQKGWTDITTIIAERSWNDERLAQPWVIAARSAVAIASNHSPEIVARPWDAVVRIAAVIGGIVSGLGSMLLYFVRRRTARLKDALIICTEMKAIAKDALFSVPPLLKDIGKIAERPRGQKLIAVTSDQKRLLLDPGAGHAGKLPRCLLEGVVGFFHADVSIGQLYQEMGSDAFAEASPSRRATYLYFFGDVWTEYQSVAYSALFRLELYQRLRSLPF